MAAHISMSSAPHAGTVARIAAWLAIASAVLLVASYFLPWAALPSDGPVVPSGGKAIPITAIYSPLDGLRLWPYALLLFLGPALAALTGFLAQRARGNEARLFAGWRKSADIWRRGEAE